MLVNTSDLYNARHRTFTLLLPCPIFEYYRKLVIHRHHLVIVEVSLRLFITCFSDGIDVLEIFCNVVVVFFTFRFVAFPVIHSSG